MVPGVAVDGVQVGQEVPQPQGDRVRAQQQGGRRLGDGVGEDEFQGMHVARSCRKYFKIGTGHIGYCGIWKSVTQSDSPLTVSVSRVSDHFHNKKCILGIQNSHGKQ